MRIPSWLACTLTLAAFGCATEGSSADAGAPAPDADIVDAIHDRPSARVTAAANALTAALAPEEIAHIEELDWNAATFDSLLFDEVYVKGLTAVLAVVDVPTERKLPPLSSPTDEATLHPTDSNVCNLKCDECRRYLQNAISIIQNALHKTAQEGLRCRTPACAGAILLKSAELSTALMYATFCLALSSTLSTTQRQSVIGKLTSCRKVDCSACPKCDADLTCSNDANGKIVKGSCGCSGCFVFSDSRCCDGKSTASMDGCGPYP